MTNADVVSQRLREALEDKTMKPIELAEKTGLSRAIISKYINKVSALSPKAAQLIGNVLKVSPKWLMGLSNEKYAHDYTWVALDGESIIHTLPEQEEQREQKREDFYQKTKSLIEDETTLENKLMNLQYIIANHKNDNKFIDQLLTYAYFLELKEGE